MRIVSVKNNKKQAIAYTSLAQLLDNEDPEDLIDNALSEDFLITQHYIGNKGIDLILDAAYSARMQNQMLIITKVGELIYNLRFLKTLRHVEFMALDTNIFISENFDILFAIAEYLNQHRGQKTKEKHLKIKLSGKSLGGPNNLTAEGLKKSNETRRKQKEPVAKIACEILKANPHLSLRKLSQILASRNYLNRNGKPFSAASVRDLLHRYTDYPDWVKSRER